MSPTNLTRIVIATFFCFLIILDSMALQVSGVVTDGKDPVSGVRVRHHGARDFVVTDSKGRFTLNIVEEPVQQYAITAGKEGWINGGVLIDPAKSYTTIVIQ